MAAQTDTPAAQSAGPTEWVGQRVKRKEDPRLLTGTGRYADDVQAVGELYCAILRSPHPHARIVRVDTSKAREIPGVVLAISGADAEPHWNQLMPVMDLLDMKLPRVYALATDKVHYEGEAVAAVAAESRYIAEDALDAIVVEYEPLPAVANLEDALGTVAPADVEVADGDVGRRAPTHEPLAVRGGGEPTALLYEEWGHNVQCDWEFEIGDPDKVFAEADHVVRRRVGTHRYSGMPMECRVVLAEHDAGRNQLTIRLSTQFPHQARTIFAATFGIPEPNIHVLADDVGAGYGNKLQVDSEVIPVLLAILTGRPIKWTENRRGWLTSAPHSRDYFHDIEGAFSSDGTLLALRNHIVGDEGCDGAVRAAGLGALLVGGTYSPGTYKVNSYKAHVQAVVTNKAPYGAYRGYGKETANLAIERLMDAAADQLGIDPIEIRRHNLIDTYPHELPSGPIIESGSFRQALEDVVEAMDLPALRRRQEEARAAGRYIGFSACVFLEPSAASIPMSVFNGYETASVRLTPDGQVMVLTGMQTIGQGMETAMAQITADRLGVRPDDVRIVYGDTNAVPYGLGSYASRGATYGMSAVYQAATQVREKLLKAAANLLEANADDLEVSDGVVSLVGAPARQIAVAEVAKAVYLFPGPYAVLPDEPNPTLEGNFVWTNPQVAWSPDEHGRVRLYPAHGGGAEGALVEVDVETGQVKVERLWVCHDVGKMINPAIVEAQVVGGMVQGFGGTMLEQLSYDDDGRMLTKTLNDYQVPNAMSAPPIELMHIETPSPITPLGTKGVGEAGCIGTPTVLMSAVEDALRPFGVSVDMTPLDPERVLRMIQASGAQLASGR
ncbi:MAG: aerobic carbon-monoxide dehydrogenase large subunit [Solirubrobacteraceae bacterium]|jgi:carbon-monoxide dehydrogenase large subunit|nr:aerobic carbon-monoxide dehydrogenase large subunit [Solirubrobacteraceae bacterium]MEA2359992.1 aerobic carbon-monoxide dehydrogenase large subunit [Solirubrobacteraceae bacterium]MEA2393900.1 aerobic carbon-monoxide dehydrogenase large subunit [Solirubrobacteraceae bacterium]